MTIIAFIGLGHMGLPMATNLIKAGHRTKGYDVSSQAVDAFIKQGGFV